ncbi:DUF6226 family protein [Agromyces bauzanensis]|uniref:DUF6226 family protein n=1 Tax=Agromyces bauzanensis TaxID=1308924 RepID=UPI00166A66E9|nr:DUF6226 family protein [Agromyces bauzanensis]
MTDYQRPALVIPTFFDAEGREIEYGHRWGGESPPDDSYSRTSNLERFAPLHTVADALIDWLAATFDVTHEEDASVASDVLRAPDDVQRAVRLTPTDSACAPLTFLLTSFTGIVLHAGALHDFLFPVCGCDACDEDVVGLADELEWTVRTVAYGGYSEAIDPWPGTWVEYRLEEDGVGMRSGRSRANDIPSERRRTAKQMLPSGSAWRPWPVRL